MPSEAQTRRVQAPHACNMTPSEATVKTRLQIEQDTYSLVITRRNASEVLCLADGPYCALPSVEISHSERVAEQTNAVVYRQFNVEAYCLSTHFPDLLHSALRVCGYCAMECLEPEAAVPSQLYWVSASSLSEATFRNSVTLTDVQRILRTITPAGPSEDAATFGKSGSLRKITNWVQNQVESLNLRLTGRFRQLSASPTFCLLRFETNGPALWFKAVGEPNIREFTITSTLAELFPDFLPRLIAVRHRWSAWLMTEPEGVAPDTTCEWPVWKTVVDRLAKLQIASAPHTSELLLAGARDVTARSLLERVDEFLLVMQAIMTQQRKTPPSIMTAKEVIALAHPLKDALSILTEGLVPDALNHLDCNPGNILVSTDRCVFFDWAEAAVGFPFLTFEYLREHFGRSCPIIAHRAAELAGHYADHWRPHIAAGALSKCLAVSPLVAVFAYAVLNDIWRDPTHLANPSTAGYFRALTRRISREAHVLEGRSPQCFRQ